MRAHPLCAVLFTACWAGPVFASTTSEDFWELSLEQLSQVEVNVASRSSERAREASSSITVFTRRDIEATGVTSVEQLMAFVPGFAVQRSIDVSSLRDSFAIRGRRRGNFNNDVLILRDGLPLNTNRLGGAGQSYFDLPLHNVRQVEVIRGPGSALYGSGAFAGVINIVTDDSLNNASASVGSHDLYAGHVNVSQEALAGRLIAQAHGFDRRGPIYRDVDDGMHLYTEDTREGRSGHDALLKWKNDSAFASIEQERRASSGYIMNRFVDDDDNHEIVEVNTARAGFTFGDVANRHDVSIAWRTFAEDLQLGFMSREYVIAANAVPVLPNGFAQPPRDLVTGVDRRASQLFFDWQWTYALNAWNSLSVGAGYDRVREDRSDIVANYDVIAQVDSQYPIATYDRISTRTDLLVDSNLVREHGSVFIQDRIRLNPELRWDIALRYDDYNQIGEAYSPRSSLVWTATADTDLKLMYSRAFRAPSLAELYNSRYNQDVGNPDLDPETIDTIEVAWSQRIRDAESTLTLYTSDVDDGIDPIVLPRVTGSNYEYAVNRSELEYRGMEWELLWQATDDVSLRAAMHHSMHADADIDAAPQNSASLILSFKRERWLASLTALYYDDIETPAQHRLADYTVVGAILNYDLDRHWRLALTANNVLNRKYRVYTRRYNVRGGQFADGLPAEPPNQMLTISYNY